MASQPSLSIHSIQRDPQFIDSPLFQSLKYVQNYYSLIQELLQRQYQINNQQILQSYQLLRQSFEAHHQQATRMIHQLLGQTNQQITIPDRIVSAEINNKMSFMQIINQIVSEGADPDQLFQFLDSINVETKLDILKIHGQVYQPKQNPRYHEPQFYLGLEIAELCIERISLYLDNGDALSQKQKSLVDYLSKDIGPIESSNELKKQYYYIKQKYELDSLQLDHFMIQVNTIGEKVINFCKKNNYESIMFSELERADVTRARRVNYSGFLKALQKLRLTISEQDISILFRYAIYIQTGVYQQLINKSFMIDYSKFLNIILRKNNDKQNDLLHSNNNLYEYKSLLSSLKVQKLELNKVLTQRENKIQALQSKLLEYELQNSNKQTTLHKILKNQRAAIKSKYESEINRLKKVNQSQKQMIDSYRIQLQNIMSEIHTRHL